MERIRLPLFPNVAANAKNRAPANGVGPPGLIEAINPEKNSLSSFKFHIIKQKLQDVYILICKTLKPRPHGMKELYLL